MVRLPGLRLDIVLNDLVASAYTTGRIYVKSDGTPWRPIVHIRDISQRNSCRAGSAERRRSTTRPSMSADRGKLPHQRIGRHRRRNCSGVPMWNTPSDGGPDKRCYRINCDKIRRVLPNFRPQWTAGLVRRSSTMPIRSSGSRLKTGTWPIRPHQPHSPTPEMLACWTPPCVVRNVEKNFPN